MAPPTVATNILQALDRQGYLGPEIALYAIAVLDHLPDAPEFFRREILDPCRLIHPRLFKDLLRRRATHAVNIRERDDSPLVVRNINSDNTRQRDSLPFAALSLPLIVPSVLADDPDQSVSLDELAVLTNLLHRRTYLHVASRPARDDPGVRITCSGK
jgi:hypothetical protein